MVENSKQLKALDDDHNRFKTNEKKNKKQSERAYEKKLADQQPFYERLREKSNFVESK